MVSVACGTTGYFRRGAGFRGAHTAELITGNTGGGICPAFVTGGTAVVDVLIFNVITAGTI